MPSENFSVDSSIYCDEKQFRREYTFIRKRSWLIACHGSEIPKAGDYFVFENLNESIIIMRNQQNEITAMRNVCLHRGSYLLKKKGNCKVIQCPYHGWKYDLDGRLISASSQNLQKSLRLEPVNSAQVGGFIWLNLGSKSQKIEDHLGETVRYFEAFDSASLVVFRKRRFYLDCNWKNYLENILDSYHISTVHNSLLNRITKVGKLEIAQERRNLLLKIPIADYKWRIELEQRSRHTKFQRELAQYYHKIHFFPNLVINFTALNATVYNILPVAPGKTIVEYTFLRPKSLNPFVHIRNLLLFFFSIVINREDNAILPLYYANVARFPQRKHHFNNAEISLIKLHKNLARYLK